LNVDVGVSKKIHLLMYFLEQTVSLYESLI
jgi:hypothetical protein